MPTRVAVLAQDLIWQDRLARAVQAAGAEAAPVRTAPELDLELFARAAAGKEGQGFLRPLRREERAQLADLFGRVRPTPAR